MKRIVSSFCLVVVSLLCVQSSFAASSVEKPLKQQTTDFTSVAKSAIPAVVSVKVKTPDHVNVNQGNQGFYDDEIDFQERFWQQFFGQRPRERREMQRPAYAQGSGFLLSSDGYILTNNHVVADSSDITVTLQGGEEIPAKVVGSDPHTDIALIKIEGHDLPYLELSDSDNLEVGQWVIAIGNPLGLQASLTVGVVSAKGRNNLDIANIEDFIQTDAAINQGNSGGPLLNLDGEVVGMNTAIVTNGAGGGYMGIGFAIPSNMARHAKEQIMATGRVCRGFLGVSLQKIDSDLAQAFGLLKVEGALVADVTSNSPAEESGIRQGDIILKYNRTDVSSIVSFKNAIAMMNPGTPLSLSILREGQEMVINIEVGTYPGEETSVIASLANRLGLEVESLTRDLAMQHGYGHESGVIVKQVFPGGPAAWVGLQKGTLILEINKQRVNSISDFSRILEKEETERPLLLLIKQGTLTRFVSIKLS